MGGKLLFDYFNPQYRAAREGGMSRSGGMRQFCGLRKAEGTHHWLMNCPAARGAKPNHLAALGKPRHREATLEREQTGLLANLRR